MPMEKTEKNMKRKLNLYLIISSILLAIIGFVFWDTIFAFFVSWIKHDYSGYTVINSRLICPTKTAFVLGIIPIILFYTWKAGKIKPIGLRVLSSITLLLITLLTIYLKIRWITPPDLTKTFSTDYESWRFVDSSQMKLWLFILIGLFIGMIINVIVFKVFKKTNMC